MRFVFWLPITSFMLVSACSSPAKITVVPKAPLIRSKAEPLVLKVTVKDSAGAVLPQAKVSFQALTPTVLVVDAQGSVRAFHSGAGAVLVKAGKVTRKVEISVVIPGRIAILPSAPVMNMGISKNFKARLFNDRGKPMLAAGKVLWSSSDPTIVSVDADGMIKTLKEGKATLTAKASGIAGSTVVTVEHEKMQADGYIGHGQ
ncbi:MAG: Ig-like domain-containing protein [Deltaproteobacteria bacterium]|nr:Ig-like domain-containing protein [Deltaproteobacteria bacterium]